LRAQIDDVHVLQLGEGQKELALEPEEVRIENQIPLRATKDDESQRCEIGYAP
jgi:hypothetical protein